MRTEVTYSEFGERGSVDVMGANRVADAAFVGEVKSEWGSIEGTLRVNDVKIRFGPRLCERAFGFRPAHLGSALVFPDDMTVRRILEKHGRTIRADYPATSREVRRWLAAPSGPMRGVWFLSDSRMVANRGDGPR